MRHINFKKLRNTVIITLSIIIAILITYGIYTYKNQPVYTDAAYTQFTKSLNAGDVTEVDYIKGDNDFTYKVKNNPAIYKTSYLYYDNFFYDVANKGSSVVISEPKSGLGKFIPYMIIVLLFGPLVIYAMSDTIKAFKDDKVEVSNTCKTRFSDIIGQDEVIEDVKFITDLIKDPGKGSDIGVTQPKGILFSGAPGTGKTLIAKAIAGEAGVPFVYANASSFVEMYVGVGAKRVRALFKKARSLAPCIVFIDEIDAVGGKRGHNGSSENDQTINALLQEMDGFNGRSGIFVIAATNRPESLDSALTRSGRFDRQVIIGPPATWNIRKQLFDHYLKNKKVSSDVNTELLAKETSGFVGADIETICNEAGMIAIQSDKNAIDHDCLENAIDKKVFKGNRSHKKVDDQDRQIVAYHEAGHAIMNYLTGHEISRASIQNTTSGVGGAVFSADDGRAFMTADKIKEEIEVAYAGRASEDIKFGFVTTGAANDIQQATSLLMKYVLQFGFDKEYGLLDIEQLKNSGILQGDKITSMLSEYSNNLYKTTKNALTDHYDLVEKLAQALLQNETMSGDEITTLLKS